MKKGFTLIELLVVIGIIAILAGIVIIAVNPGRQLGQARDAQRWNDVNALLNGIHQYAVDFDGAFPAVIDNDDATVQIVGTGVACPATCTGQTVAVVCEGLDCYTPAWKSKSYQMCAAFYCNIIKFFIEYCCRTYLAIAHVRNSSNIISIY